MSEPEIKFNISQDEILRLPRNQTFAQVERLAERLGVSEMPEGAYADILITTASGKRYDFLELVSAFLDKMDGVLP